MSLYIYSLITFVLINAVNSDFDLYKLRTRVKLMFEHAYNGYLKYAYPYDELRPITCDGKDTWGSFSLTLIDALDTLIVMGKHEDFIKSVELLEQHLDPLKDVNVSVFETNIRVIGGLLSAHLLSKRVTNFPIENSWPCSGRLLQLAERFAQRLLVAFDTPTGMPYGTVNLAYGVPKGETQITCTACAGTFILEFGALTQLTGDPRYETVALKALDGLWKHRSSLNMVGNHVNISNGVWTSVDSGIGAGIDSYLEYLVKGSIMFQNKQLLSQFRTYKAAIESHIRHDDWFFWVNVNKATISFPIFQSLEAYWPGLLSLLGETETGLKSLHNYHQIWKQYGFTPEFYNVPNRQPVDQREAYPLRPELIESIYYIYRETRDPIIMQMGVDILESIERVAKTRCGYATVLDVTTHELENQMESFFLAETTKYLYLLFDEDNFLHASPQTQSDYNALNFPDTKSPYITKLPSGGSDCILGVPNSYIFNTEAHPLDPGALHCCSVVKLHDDINLLDLTSENNLVRILNLSVPDPLLEWIEKDINEVKVNLTNNHINNQRDLGVILTDLHIYATGLFTMPSEALSRDDFVAAIDNSKQRLDGKVNITKIRNRAARVINNIDNKKTVDEVGLGCMAPQFSHRWLLYGEMVLSETKDLR